MTQLVQSPPKPLAIRAPQALSHGLVHPVYLTGLRHGSRALDAKPVIVERRDQEFVQGLLDDLTDANQHTAVLAAAPAKQSGTMRVFPPLQRVFNMLVLEAFCDVPGQPRLEPKKIESSGFVLRRVDGTRKLAWLKAGTKVFGWEAVDEDLDPAQDRRGKAVTLGHPVLDALAPSQQRIRTAGSTRLAASAVPVSEDVQPLFIAPPDVCKGAGKTLLFGNLKVVSGELTEAAPNAPAFGTDSEERDNLRADMVIYLLPGGARTFPVPSQRNISTNNAHTASQTAVDSPSQPALSRSEYNALDQSLGLLLLQLNNQYDAFGTGTGALAMQSAIKQLQVETDVPAANGQPARVDKRNAWQFLLDAKAVFFDAVPGASVSIPNRWGAVSDAIGNAIFEASLVCMQQQFAKLLPASGRFENGRNGVEPHFVVRAFVRLKPEHDGCPGRIVWSQYSDEFTIAPWFESSGAPVPVIPLPDLMDRNQLSKVKPTVAFALPPKLAKLLKGSSDDLMKGKGSGDPGIGLGWICSFSLPIITLCAFICLNIFLSLFNLIFQWMAFLKICIPIPKAKE
ncbi:hypothetical protein [Piscinibacter terrae]|uniref:Uncharacterized protein n=1 Tax=Piscinibacter terrae TaxID=2496871 RepID=A0A3N7HHI7_9BURK|nr:hypothetical protein [Albitalea terrae]RQP21478.1 hypothetical protein DZC73_26515 [Albitalea terrae]